MSAPLTQEDRHLNIETPLGPDVLLLDGFSGKEELSRLFSYHLELLSENPAITPRDIVGQNVTFSVSLDGREDRHFNGFINRFRAGRGKSEGIRKYWAEVVPWLWFLTRTSNCRIFQNKSAPEIIEQVFSDNGFSDFEIVLHGSHPSREYCVQYNETDFDFISRLMESGGIFYFFRHELGKHTLVLADSSSAYWFCEPQEVPFSDGSLTPNHVREWSREYEFCSGSWARSDYDFKNPTSNLLTSTKTILELPEAEKYERYEYPGGYVDKDAGDAVTRIRLEEQELQFDVATASSDCVQFTPGMKFNLIQHDYDSENGKYAIIAIEHSATEPTQYSSGNATSGEYYSNTFRCIPESVVFRPARTTPKPIVQGPQTAVVVGPAGEKVYPDEFGRVKVQFHWDREASGDENSSCWIRVSQSSAGQGWGAMFIPHVGHEVVVSFLEGDPDQPLITGRVYNANQTVPDSLPDHKHESVIRDDYGNEILFNATPGDEHMVLHSPHHQSKLVLGKSKREDTQSDSIVRTQGNSFVATVGEEVRQVIGNHFKVNHGFVANWTSGFVVNVQVGAKADAFQGMKYQFTLGGEVSAAMSFKVHIGWSREIILNNSKYVRTSNDDIKIDSNKQLWLCGGDEDNSIIKCDTGELTIAFGEATKPAKWDLAKWVATPLALATGTVSAFAASAEACAAESKSLADEHQDGHIHIPWPENDFTKLVTPHATKMAAGAAAAGLTWLANCAGEQQDPEHDSVFGKISLKKDGVKICHGDGSAASVNDHGRVWVLKERVDLFGPDAITLLAKELYLNAEEEVSLKAPKVKVNDKFITPNIEDSGK